MYEFFKSYYRAGLHHVPYRVVSIIYVYMHAHALIYVCARFQRLFRQYTIIHAQMQHTYIHTYRTKHRLLTIRLSDIKLLTIRLLNIKLLTIRLLNIQILTIRLLNIKLLTIRLLNIKIPTIRLRNMKLLTCL